MPPAHPEPATASARASQFAVAAFFFVNGSIVGGWVPYVPDKARALVLNPARLGAILLAAGIGATLAMPLAGWFTARIGSKRVALLAGCVLPVALFCAVVAPSPWFMACALFAMGMCGASMDVAMNAQGVLVEERLGRRTISALHGIWSLGGMLGSAATAAALSRGVKPLVSAASLALLLIALLLSIQNKLIAHADEFIHERPALTWPSRRLLLFGILAFAAMLSEGAIADWSGLFLRTIRGLGAGVVGYGYSAFAAAMVIGRLTGDGVVARLNEARTLRFGGLLAAVGAIVVLLTHTLAASLPGFALLGFGLSNTSPILYRSAGKVPGVPPGVGIATAVSIGYAGLLIGPPLLGVLAQHTSLASIFAVVAALCVLLSGASAILPHARATW